MNLHFFGSISAQESSVCQAINCDDHCTTYILLDEEADREASARCLTELSEAFTISDETKANKESTNNTVAIVASLSTSGIIILLLVLILVALVIYKQVRNKSVSSTHCLTQGKII